jgi:DNA-binding GntR family transcriptional regulator
MLDRLEAGDREAAAILMRQHLSAAAKLTTNTVSLGGSLRARKAS